MKRGKRIVILLAVLVVACLATFAALRYEERQEQIRNSEEVILSLSAEEVQTLRWSYDDTDLSFARDANGVWRWEEDAAFPVSEEKVNELLEVFSAFSVSFVIEDVTDQGQYGLDEPVCTIELATADRSYTVKLGDFSKVDARRYVSVGDGNAYLVSTDPMDAYELAIADLIEHDRSLSYETVTAVSFSGAEEWSVSRVEEGEGDVRSVCAEDVYFTGSLPLDTGLVDGYLGELTGLDLSSYISYNATAEELERYGLDDPELTVTVDYILGGGDGESEGVPGSYTLHISRSAAQRAMTEEEEEALTAWAAYARVGDSRILYQIGSSDFKALMAAGYDDLRHRGAFTAGFSLVTAVDITLEGESYTLTARAGGEEGETVWFYGEEEISVDGVQSALEALEAEEFTDLSPDGRQEIGLMLHLEHEHFSRIEIVLYRYDGASCLAVVDGESFALVPRGDVVELIEAVNAIILN